MRIFFSPIQFAPVFEPIRAPYPIRVDRFRGELAVFAGLGSVMDFVAAVALGKMKQGLCRRCPVTRQRRGCRGQCCDEPGKGPAWVSHDFLRTRSKGSGLALAAERQHRVAAAEGEGVAQRGFERYVAQRAADDVAHAGARRVDVVEMGRGGDGLVIQ